jgi:hypothetical protein
MVEPVNLEGRLVDERGFLVKSTNEGVYYEKKVIWISVIYSRHRNLFGELLVLPAAAGNNWGM